MKQPWYLQQETEVVIPHNSPSLLQVLRLWDREGKWGRFSELRTQED